MSAVWSEMRKARTQVAIEAVLIRIFNKPSEVLERKIIQSTEFRRDILPAWAQYSIKNDKALTDRSISELLRVKVGSAYQQYTIPP